MAAAAGKTGYVKLGATTVALIKDWKLSFKMGKEDITSFPNTKGVTRIATIMDVSGSFEGTWDGADTNGQVQLQTNALAGTSTTLLLYVNATNYYTGSCLLDLDIDTSVDGVPHISFTFEQDGGTAWTQAA